MRHLPNSNDPEELKRLFNRVWDAFDALSVTGLSNSGRSTGTTLSAGVASGSFVGTGAKGSKGDTGATGPTGANVAEKFLIGSLDQWEVLMASDGGVLCGQSGYALMGVNTTNTVLCGVTGDEIQPLEY